MGTASEYMHGARQFRVTATVTVVRTAGHDQYLRRGVVLPADVASATVDHLLRSGHIVEIKSPEEAS